jgi:hypothetical protein
MPPNCKRRPQSLLRSPAHIVSIPTLPTKGGSGPAAVHLRALTDYVYLSLIGPVET